MKDFISPDYIFTPGAAGVGTVNLSGISNFDVKRLAAIINQTRGVIIYSTGDSASRYTALNGSTLTLNIDTSTHSASDVLQVVYNDTLQDDMVQALYEVISRLDYLASVRGIAADLRVTLLSGVLTTLTTVTTVTTVSTVSNQTAMGGWAATQQIPAMVNQTAIQSNLNNVVVS